MPKQILINKVAMLVFLFSTACLSAQSLSFEEAVVKLNSGNKNIKGKQKQEEAKGLAIRAAQGLRYPHLSLNGSFTYLADDLYFDANGFKPGVGNFFNNYIALLQAADQPLVAQQLSGMGGQFLARDWNFKFQEQAITRFSLDLKYPVYTGGKIKTAIKAKEIEAKIAETETAKTKGILIAELAERYFQTQLANEAIEVRKQALESAKEHLYNAQKMEENGMLAPVETMLANTSVADSERALLAAKKDAELAQTALEGLLGGEENFAELTTELFKAKALNTAEYYQKLAQENYPDIVKASFQKQLAEQNINLQKAHHLPEVGVIARKYLVTDNLPLTEPDNWYVGMGVKMDLFTGFQNKRKHEEAIAMEESVALFIEQAKTDIQTLVKKYYTEILKQQEQLESLEESTAFAEELVRVRTQAFQESFATSTDVADANLYLASIKIQRLQALFEIDKNLAKLLEVCGASDTFSNYIN